MHFTSAHEYKKYLLQDKPKKCRDCGEEKSRDQFHAHGGNYGDGLVNFCKPCHNAYSAEATRKSRQNNPERHKQYNKKYYSKPENKAKAKKYMQDHRAKTSVAGLTTALHGVKIAEDDQEGTCYWCGTTQPESGRWGTDHIMPLQRYGCHLEENIVHSCQSCNSLKHTKHPLTWLASLF